MPMNIPLNEDAACFADALEGFAALCAADQAALIADLRAGHASTPAIQAARFALADAVDGAFDEDIADALRAGATEPQTPTH